ncbi:serine/threonine-protein kinase [Glycomyces arizonensis]|uniref:serine/threonine-protein kinase n=1 Tax=Glycomyces arizonensis TaxID=256035 RepID=UPI0004241582|nr:serine/threonine-protein kinase [Glycomyces arizonensis]
MQLGTLIAGRYRLDDRIAAGGMGEVWRGTDTRLNRAVAVKLLHSGLSGNDRFRARFHQEAQAVAALQSPGIVALYDYGEEHSAEGLVSYLIMELVQGQSLANLIHQRGRLAPNEVLKIVATAAEALDVAHRAHIVHRDIKPANLLVNEDGAVKIVDFGIASARGQAGLTETGTVMGTLSYASPEQLAGHELSGATDVYSLGIVAYECLAGRPPFPGNDPAAVITAHMTGQPAPLPQDVPQPVAQIVMRCLAKDPRQRFGSAAELAQACRTGRPGSGTTAILPPASPPTAGTRAMAQGMVPVSTQPPTQAMGQGDFSSPPRGRDLPPPREFEEAKRSKAVPVTITILGVVVLVVALVMWQMLQPEDDKRAEGDTGTETPSAAVETSAAEDETTAAEEENTDDSGGEEGDGDSSEGNSEDDSSNEEDTSDDETTPAADDDAGPETAVLESYSGWSIHDALADLESDGFTNFTSKPAEDVGNGVTCQVTQQTPEGDQEVALDEPIELVYIADEENCGL